MQGRIEPRDFELLAIRLLHLAQLVEILLAIVDHESLLELQRRVFETERLGPPVQLRLVVAGERMAAIDQRNRAGVAIDVVPKQKIPLEQADGSHEPRGRVDEMLFPDEHIAEIDARNQRDENHRRDHVIDARAFLCIEGRAQRNPHHARETGVGQPDEDAVDREKVERPEKEGELPGRQPVTSRAERRHERRGDRHARHHVALELRGQRNRPGQSAEKRDQHVVDGWTRACQQLGVSDGERRDGEVEGRSKQARRHREREVLERFPKQRKVVGCQAVAHAVDRPHERRNQHRADNDRRGVHVEADRGEDDGGNQHPDARAAKHNIGLDRVVDGIERLRILAQADNTQQRFEHGRQEC